MCYQFSETDFDCTDTLNQEIDHLFIADANTQNHGTLNADLVCFFSG